MLSCKDAILSPAEIKTQMIEFLEGIGYVAAEEYAPGVANPRVEKRESAPLEMVHQLFVRPSASREKTVTLITNSSNDVVVAKLCIGNEDAMLSHCYEINTAYDREYAQQELVALS